MKRIIAGLLCLLLAMPAAASESLGVILMHGKGGAPDKAILSLGRNLEGAGFVVMRPEMPWSGRRGFDKTYEESLAEIDGHIAAMKAKGVGRVVLAGHSLGANAAIAYAATRQGAVQAVMAIAPGHQPNAPQVVEKIGSSVAKASEMVAAGKGDETATFLDINQARSYEVSERARVYLSFQDPEGLASMPAMARRITAPLPFLYVVGDDDPIIKRGRGYIFDLVPPDPANRYVEVRATHMNTPEAAASEIIAWLKAIAAGS